MVFKHSPTKCLNSIVFSNSWMMHIQCFTYHNWNIHPTSLCFHSMADQVLAYQMGRSRCPVPQNSPCICVVSLRFAGFDLRPPLMDWRYLVCPASLFFRAPCFRSSTVGILQPEISLVAPSAHHSSADSSLSLSRWYDLAHLVFEIRLSLDWCDPLVSLKLSLGSQVFQTLQDWDRLAECPLYLQHVHFLQSSFLLHFLLRRQKTCIQLSLVMVAHLYPYLCLPL